MKLKGYLFAIVSAIFFGTSGIFVKNGYSDNFTPTDILMLQYIIAGIILLFICIIKYKQELKISKEMLKKLIIQGAFANTLMTVFFYSSFKYLDVSIATMLLYTYPAMVAAFSFIFLKDKITKSKAIAILGTFTGCIMVLNISSNNLKNISLTGISFGILSAVFYTFMNIYAKKIVEDIHPVVITFYTTLFSLIVLIIFNFNFILKLPYISNASILNAGLLAFFCEIIPLTLLYAAIKYIGPVSTSIIGTLELPSAALLSYIFLNEKLSMLQIIGIVIVIYCVIILKKEED
ncbi:Threonine/homoserine efflux transporter RhtA [Caloramator quimbayensis]|uniref:Threonine/homoserine efflux transporter RhtA n=1 Tax=Caloramator quimbayensis TaxID=1147123 RepID=A0A1T4X7P1_9CLOT|nr:DMT family transporter [Caloramator quimbayensis]SKA85128.1 Threonine/homoserine efflux transporter RhtA [Caloramator quimbayensis]